MFDDCFSFPWLLVKVRRYSTMCNGLSNDTSNLHLLCPGTNPSQVSCLHGRISLHPYGFAAVTYQDIEGNSKEWEDISQSVGELLQHEIQHLDGILALSLAEVVVVPRVVQRNLIGLGCTEPTHGLCEPRGLRAKPRNLQRHGRLHH